MEKTKLLKVLEAYKDDAYHLTRSRDYHKPEKIMDVVREVLEYAEDEISEADDLRESINEQADCVTPIYNKDLLEWLADNYGAYEETVDEVGEAKNSDGKTDLMRGIMTAYCLTLEREAEAALLEVWKEAEELEDEAEAGKEGEEK